MIAALGGDVSPRAFLRIHCYYIVGRVGHIVPGAYVVWPVNNRCGLDGGGDLVTSLGMPSATKSVNSFTRPSIRPSIHSQIYSFIHSFMDSVQSSNSIRKFGVVFDEVKLI